MEEWLEGLEPVVVHQDLKVPYRYSMGPAASRFFIEIRDNRKIMGIRCPQCDVVFIPPRATCGRCFSQLQEWVEVGNQGALETYAQVRYSTPVQPAVAPFYYGIIKLDGADTGLAHMIGDLKGKEPRSGMRVQAVFRENRRGDMLDILYFQPIEEKQAIRDAGQKGRKEEKAKRRKILQAKKETKGKKISRKKTAKVKATKTVKRVKSARKRATVPRPKTKRKR